VAVALDAYVRSHEPYREMVRIASGVDANRVTVRNPFVPLVRMKLSTVLLIMPAHDRRHLWQAAQVKTKPGFPR
jgi:predicted double-glycine peptidase